MLRQAFLAVLIVAAVPLALIAGYFYVLVFGLEHDRTMASLDGALTLRVERRQISPLGLPEYRRLLTIESGGRRRRLELGLDHGGVVQLKVYALQDGTIALVDRLGSVGFDPVSGSERPVRWACGMTRPEGAARYLGRFDRAGPGDARHVLRWWPAAEAAEQPSEVAPETC